MKDRVKVEDKHVTAALLVIKETLAKRIRQHGPGAYAGPHEGLGIVTEEYFELVEAVRSNVSGQVEREYLDLTIAGLFGLASLYATWEAEAHKKAREVGR